MSFLQFFQVNIQSKNFETEFICCTVLGFIFYFQITTCSVTLLSFSKHNDINNSFPFIIPCISRNMNFALLVKSPAQLFLMCVYIKPTWLLHTPSINTTLIAWIWPATKLAKSSLVSLLWQVSSYSHFAFLSQQSKIAEHFIDAIRPVSLMMILEVRTTHKFSSTVYVWNPFHPPPPPPSPPKGKTIPIEKQLSPQNNSNKWRVHV